MYGILRKQVVMGPSYKISPSKFELHLQSFSHHIKLVQTKNLFYRQVSATILTCWLRFALQQMPASQWSIRYLVYATLYSDVRPSE